MRRNELLSHSERVLHGMIQNPLKIWHWSEIRELVNVKAGALTFLKRMVDRGLIERIRKGWYKITQDGILEYDRLSSLEIITVNESNGP